MGILWGYYNLRSKKCQGILLKYPRNIPIISPIIFPRKIDVKKPLQKIAKSNEAPAGAGLRGRRAVSTSPTARARSKSIFARKSHETLWVPFNKRSMLIYQGFWKTVKQGSLVGNILIYEQQKGRSATPPVLFSRHSTCLVTKPELPVCALRIRQVGQSAVSP